MKKKEANGETESFLYMEQGLRSLICCLHDLFIAGSETTSTTLLWSIVFLMRHPEIQERIHTELDGVFGYIYP